MRVAVVSDIHGNLPALEAVVADLREVRPDLVVHGGDVALGGPHPVEVVDRLRELGWPGVLGNTDELLSGEPAVTAKVRGFVAEAGRRTVEMLGPERVSWLVGLPLEWRDHDLAVVHATPGDCWRIVAHDAEDGELLSTFGPLRVPVAVYCHIHHALVRAVDGLTVANSGSVSLSLDGDPRASYLLVEDGKVLHRRVAYDMRPVIDGYAAVDYPNAAGYARWLAEGRYD